MRPLLQATGTKHLSFKYLNPYPAPLKLSFSLCELKILRSFSISHRLLSEDSRIFLDGPSSSWFLPKPENIIKDPISPNSKKPSWSEIQSPRPILQNDVSDPKNAIELLRERYPYKKVLAAIRESYHPQEQTAYMDLRLAVRWLRRSFAYFHMESIFGFLTYCYQEFAAAGSSNKATHSVSRELVELLKLLLRRQPKLFVPQEVYNFALLDLASHGDCVELISLAEVLVGAPDNRDFLAATLRVLLQLWCRNKSEAAASFFLTDFMPKEIYHKIPISELALDMRCSEFSSFVEMLPQLFQVSLTKDLVSLIKEKLCLGQLQEAMSLRAQLLELDAEETSRYMEAFGKDVADELLRKWSDKSISSIHARAFFMFPPTQEQCYEFVTKINEELRQRLKSRRPVSSNMANVLLENIATHGYILDTRLYSGLIVMFCRMGDMQQAEELLAAQCEAGLQPLDLTATMLMWGYTRIGNMEQGVAALQRLHLKGIRVNIIHVTQLIKLYSLNPDGLPDVLNTIRYMESLRLCPDIVTFQVLIDAMIFFKRPDLLDSALKQMSQLGVACDILLYTSLVIHFGRELSRASLIYTVNRVFELGLELTPEYVTHTLLSSARCKVSLEHLESKLGPPLASQHRKDLQHMVPIYLQFIKVISSDKIALRNTVVRFLEAWAPSSSPNDYPQLAPLVDCLAQCIYQSQDANLLSLFWYAHAKHFIPLHDISDDTSQLSETKSIFKWALDSIAQDKIIISTRIFSLK
ncbi:hypothetical protein DSO57_1038242 [Entomophthora muscae]|nr:hypothetical protein DSO57_1038242 [Entomophthora muscae]